MQYTLVPVSADSVQLEINNQPVATVSFDRTTSELGLVFKMELAEIAVFPEHLGSGYGKLLLAHFAKTATQINSGKLEWSLNASNKEFFELIGAIAPYSFDEKQSCATRNIA